MSPSVRGDFVATVLVLFVLSISISLGEMALEDAKKAWGNYSWGRKLLGFVTGIMTALVLIGFAVMLGVCGWHLGYLWGGK